MNQVDYGRRIRITNTSRLPLWEKFLSDYIGWVNFEFRSTLVKGTDYDSERFVFLGFILFERNVKFLQEKE